MRVVADDASAARCQVELALLADVVVVAHGQHADNHPDPYRNPPMVEDVSEGVVRRFLKPHAGRLRIDDVFGPFEHGPEHDAHRKRRAEDEDDPCPRAVLGLCLAKTDVAVFAQGHPSAISNGYERKQLDKRAEVVLDPISCRLQCGHHRFRHGQRQADEDDDNDQTGDDYR